MAIVGIVGPNCAGKTVLCYVLGKILREITNYNVVLIDLDYRNKQTLEVLLTGFRRGTGVYTVSSDELPIYQVEDRLQIVPPGITRYVNLRDREVVNKVLRVLKELKDVCRNSILLIDVAISLDTTLGRAVTAHSDVVIHVFTDFSNMREALDDILLYVDPKPKVIQVKNMSRDGDDSELSIRFNAKLFGNYNLNKIYKWFRKPVVKLASMIIAYISKIVIVQEVNRKIDFEKLL